MPGTTSVTYRSNGLLTDIPFKVYYSGMKECKRCGSAKPDNQFYATDTSCKACRILLVRKYREQNIEKILEYDRNRPNGDARKADNKLRYRKRVSTPEGRELERARSTKWVRDYRNSDKRAAHIIAGNALRSGRLVPKPCVICETLENIHAHHEDYAKPLEVIWLCRKHHGARHREINEERRKDAA